MSKIYPIVVILVLSGQASFLFADETPDANDGGGVLPLASGMYSRFEETTYNEPNWVLVLSDVILREDFCSDPSEEKWYEKVFNPCFWAGDRPEDNRYFSLESCAEPGEAFPLSSIGIGTLDSLYVREGVGFQLYGPDEQSYGPYMLGPKYVSIDLWITRAPYGFEPGTFFVHGEHAGDLANYSIIIYPNPLELTVEVVEEPNCVSPDDYITYAICYTPGGCEHGTLEVIDYLPREVDFIEADPNTGVYDPCGHTYTWDLGDVTGGDPNCFEILVQVNRYARPLEQIVNKVKAKSDTSFVLVTEGTLVCLCGDYGQIIYVDASVNVPEPNGTSWETAFNSLQDGLAVALPCDEIWVADGEYKPSDPNAIFQLGHSVRIYGGFKGLDGEEANRYERNWFDNETILNGQIAEANADYVVSISDANAFNVIDGFTIKGGSIAGIYCDDVSPIVGHNKITDNGAGIYCNRTKEMVAKNNWIFRNDYGLYFESPTDVAVVRNNTIVNNNEVGIYLEAGSEPNITNCIFAGHPKDSDLVGCYATYSYIEYPTVFDPNATPPDIGQGNIDGDPNYILFLDGDNDDYRLDPCSACIDAGDPCGNYTGERDIDKHFRVLDGDGVDGKIVDMGADEYCNEGEENSADFNADGIVDTSDLAEIGGAWLVDYTDPDWNDGKYDLYDDNTIDFRDFAHFGREWLWVACWKMPDIPMGMMGMDGMMGAESVLISETAKVDAAGQQQISEVQPPSVAGRIEQIKELLDWLSEHKDEIDEDVWLSFVTGLEEMLEELEE